VRLARSTKVIDLPNDKLQTPLHFAAFYQHLRAAWQQARHFKPQDVL
jgi:ankyrin repeat protein